MFCLIDFCRSQTNLSEYLVHSTHRTVVGNCGSCTQSNLPKPSELHTSLLSYTAAGYLQPTLWPPEYGGMAHQHTASTTIVGTDKCDIWVYGETNIWILLNLKWLTCGSVLVIRLSLSLIFLFSGARVVSGWIWRGLSCAGSHQPREKGLLSGSYPQSGCKSPHFKKESW